MTTKSIRLSLAQNSLLEHGDPLHGEKKKGFFKYCQSRFLGVRAPVIKKIAKEFSDLNLGEILHLWQSDVHEEQSLATAILCHKFRRGDEETRGEIYHFYLDHRLNIRDWNGVDDSAPYIVGGYLLHRERGILYQLVLSDVVWDRRIAIVATWWFIRHQQLDDTMRLAELLLNDRHDMIHKAAGWMLREAGKRNISLLKRFLDRHHKIMPRTMLRYALEKLPPEERKYYML